jgi:cellulose synthase (UDP-forming)
MPYKTPAKTDAALYQQLQWPRQAVVVLFLLFAGWYLTWRLSSFNPHARALSALLYAAELWGMLTTLLHLFMVWRLTVRIAPPPLRGLTVDVFIPTINEPVEVVRRTVLASVNMEYPHETWLLDDGNRPEMAALAREQGCHYLARGTNAHAKAGNLNHALAYTHGQFIAIFDADHAPKRTFLTRTLGFFSDRKVAFVQTPQDFYNLDSFQHRWKRGSTQLWTEQSLFFRVIQRGKDYWNAAFFCGSCAVIRRSALDEIGGFAAGTVTEDLHTSIRLHKKGFKSIYCAESLAFGMAPGTMAPFIRQRVRWGQGAMQVWRQEGVLFGRGLTLAQRLNYFASMSTYFDGWQKAIFYLAPVLVLLTGVMPIAALNGEFLVHFIPYYLLSFLLFEEVGRGFGQTLYIEQYNLARFAAFMWATVGFFRRDLKFKVTWKTRVPPSSTAWYTMPQMLVLAGNGLAICIGIALALAGRGLPWEALAANVLWAGVNCGLALLLLSFTRRVSRFQRGDYRFPVPFPARVETAPGRSLFCVADDLSITGCRLGGRAAALASGETVNVRLYLPAGPVTLDAVVRWRSEASEDGPACVGCEFSPASIEIRQGIEEVLYGSDSQWGALGLRENMRTPLELVRLLGPAPDGISLKGGEWIPILCRTAADSVAHRLGVAYVGEQRRIERVLMHAPLRSGSVVVKRIGVSATKSEEIWIANDSNLRANSASGLYVYTTAEKGSNAAWQQPRRQFEHAAGAGMKGST